jgi:hypothetical protein
VASRGGCQRAATRKTRQENQPRAATIRRLRSGRSALHGGGAAYAHAAIARTPGAATAAASVTLLSKAAPAVAV